MLQPVGSEYRLRRATETDAEFLLDMLVEAVNWLPGREHSRRAVMKNPDLARYLDGWPRSGELGVVAEAEGQPIGAVWLRLFTADEPGYGYVADEIPELSMAVVRSWRGRGVGRALLREMARRAGEVGRRAISLGVERANFAHRLYTSEGYQVVQRGVDSDTMLKEFQPDA